MPSDPPAFSDTGVSGEWLDPDLQQLDATSRAATERMMSHRPENGDEDTTPLSEPVRLTSDASVTIGERPVRPSLPPSRRRSVAPSQPPGIDTSLNSDAPSEVSEASGKKKRPSRAYMSALSPNQKAILHSKPMMSDIITRVYFDDPFFATNVSDNALTTLFKNTFVTLAASAAYGSGTAVWDQSCLSAVSSPPSLSPFLSSVVECKVYCCSQGVRPECERFLKREFVHLCVDRGRVTGPSYPGISPRGR